MPFGYLEFSRAIGRKPCSHMRTYAGAGAGPGTGSGTGSGSGLGLGAGSLPSLVLFELGLMGMGCEEGSENSTDSLIELLSESGTSEEEYFSTFLLPP